MNSLQIVSLKYWKQLALITNCEMLCCEFLTNCIFEVLKTVNNQLNMNNNALWIPYKLYLWSIENSFLSVVILVFCVVNSLQIVSLKYWKQCRPCRLQAAHRCEFLTNCIFEVLKTVVVIIAFITILLWIPYKLYLWSIENS